MSDAPAIHLEYDSFGRLILTVGTERHVGVYPVRAFPFSTPTEWISFCDETGREVFLLEDLSQLAESVRQRLEADLAQREFIPRIERIDSVSAGAEPTEWNVLTDRGQTRFTLTSEDSLRRMGANGALLTDAHGIRYLIADLDALDAASRRILRRYL